MVDIDVLGTIREVFDDEGTCDVEITAVGLDEFDRICPISEVLTWNSLQDITRQWEALPTHAKTSILTEWLGTTAGVAIYKGTFSPHDYASDTNAIQNSDLVHLLYDAAAFFFGGIHGRARARVTLSVRLRSPGVWQDNKHVGIDTGCLWA